MTAICCPTVKVPLTRGYFAVVDEDDMPIVSKYRWMASGPDKNIHAVASVGEGVVRLHRLIMGVESKPFVVDHIDGNTLNCSRSNMRVTTQRDNTRNRRKWKASATSRYKGVCWHKKSGKWTSAIRAHNKTLYLGLFLDEEDAARAYDVAARKHFGEFACVNFPKAGERGCL